MEGEWVYQEDNRAHKIRAKLPLTLSISKHKLSVFLDDELIHESGYISVVAGEIERLEINGNLFVFSVTGFGILGKLKLQINGRDAQTIDQMQMLSTGNQIQPKPTAQSISKSLARRRPVTEPKLAETSSVKAGALVPPTSTPKGHTPLGKNILGSAAQTLAGRQKERMGN